MTTLNPFISNGTCYLAANTESDIGFAPCGNDVFGHRPCCQLRDFCLSNNACYNSEHGATYLAGCSDPEYADASCPDKAGLTDTPWTGLVYCNGTSNVWNVCAQQAKPATLTDPDTCWCPENEDERRLAFSAPSTLEQIASMPATLGGSVAFQPGHFPTQGPVTVTADPVNPTSDTTPVPTSTDGPVDDGSGDGLSVGAKIGIGVGAGLGGLVLLGLIAFILISRRRRDRKSPPESINPTDGDFEEARYPSELPSTEVKPVSSQPSPLIPGKDARFSTTPSTPSELGSGVARPWSMRSELDGSDVSRSPAIGFANGGGDGDDRDRALSPVAELPG